MCDLESARHGEPGEPPHAPRGHRHPPPPSPRPQGLAGLGAVIGIGVFLATWVAGLTGLGALAQAKADPVFQLVTTLAGIAGGLLSTMQRVWSPSVRATHYRAAREAYGKLRKRAKLAAGADSVAALEGSVKSLEAKLDDLYDTCPDVPVDRDGFARGGGCLLAATLGLGSFFYPCSACLAPSDPKKPADRRPGREDLV